MAIKKIRPILPILTLIKAIKTNTNLRVSQEAGIEVSNILEEFSEKIIKKANLLALNKNKKTIQKEDIVLAKKLSK